MPVGSITIMHGSNNTVRRLMHSFKGMGPVLCSVTIYIIQLSRMMHAFATIWSARGIMFMEICDALFAKLVEQNIYSIYE